MGVSTVRPLQPHRAVRALVILFVMTAALMLTAPAPNANAQPADTLGVYAGAGLPDGVRAFEGRLGRDVAVVHDALARENWDTLAGVDWWLSQWGSTKYAQRVTYSVAMLPDSGGSLAEGATGAYNAHFRLLAQRLVAGGRANATLRLGPEFNGSWFKWTIAAPNGGNDFAAYWRQIVTTMRSVPGANFKFDWCPNGGSSMVDGQRLSAESAWPGDAFVDYVGLDVYDQSWAAHRADPVARWNEILNTPDGLRWHRDFAAAHGKPMSFPEWGISNRTDGMGGGDNPYFIDQMYEWIRTNNVAYHMYFEYADGDSDYAIFGGKAPQAAARFVQLFGAGATGAPLSALGGTPAGSPPTSTTAAKRTSPKTSRRTCVSRPLKVRGKVVRKKGKIVMKRICKTVKKSVKKRSPGKVSKPATGSAKKVSATSTGAGRRT